MTKRQSNSTEYCPVCLKPLSNRLAATSHYRAHARAGELVQRGIHAIEWRLPEHKDQPNAWWDRGVRWLYREKTAPMGHALADEQHRFLFNHEHGLNRK